MVNTALASIQIEHVLCCYNGCDAMIIMPSRVMKQFRENHASWYCYRGHQQRFTSESDKEQLEKRLANVQKRLEWATQSTQQERERAEKIERKLAATKGHLTRQKKRAAAGVCPCCNRTFKQLAAHMESQHPDYAK